MHIYAIYILKEKFYIQKEDFTGIFTRKSRVHSYFKLQNKIPFQLSKKL